MKSFRRYLLLAFYTAGFFALENLLYFCWIKESYRDLPEISFKQAMFPATILAFYMSPVTLMIACFFANLLDYVIERMKGGEK